MLNPDQGGPIRRQTPLERVEEALKRFEELQFSDDPELLRRACEELKALEDALKDPGCRIVSLPDALKTYCRETPGAIRSALLAERIALTPEAEAHFMAVLADASANPLDRISATILLSGGSSPASLKALGGIIHDLPPYGATTTHHDRDRIGLAPDAIWALGRRGGSEAAKILADEFLRHFRCCFDDELAKALAACRAEGAGERILQARIYNSKRLDKILQAVTGCQDARVFELIEEIIDISEPFNLDYPARTLTAMTEEQGKHLYRKFAKDLPNSDVLLSMIAKSVAHSTDTDFFATIRATVAKLAPGWWRANIESPYSAQDNATQIVRHLRVLEQNRHADVVELMGFALTIRYDSPRVFAVKQLTGHRCAASSAYLRKALAISDPAILVPAVRALAESSHDPEATTAAFVKLLTASDGFPEVLTETALALEKRTGPGVAEAFKVAMARQIQVHPNLTVIRCAAPRIKDLSGAQSLLWNGMLVALDRTAYGGSYDAARACANALAGRFAAPRTANWDWLEQEAALEKDLRSLVALRRECAAIALKGSQNPRIRHELSKLTTDPNSRIADAAKSALA